MVRLDNEASMIVQFTPEQFALLKSGFAIGDPTDTFEPDDMPVPPEAVEQLRSMLNESTDGTLLLTKTLAWVLEGCFTVGTEGGDIPDEALWSEVIAILRRVRGIILD
jgi:hypothetical protein